MKEILVALSIFLLSIVGLPVFFLFLWLTDTTKSFSELMDLPHLLSGLGILFLVLYFARMILIASKSLKI